MARRGSRELAVRQMRAPTKNALTLSLSKGALEPPVSLLDPSTGSGRGKPMFLKKLGVRLLSF